MEQPAATYPVHGPSLRKRRMALGLTVQEAADKAGISRSYLQRLETGIRERMGPKRYTRLRTALNATNDQISPPPEIPTEER
ncbi:helix-turn-helix domain-containing protein [Streptomyces sp. NPDC091281]|uniref:helix-turn-helix domain-containing protein n=1 Tax=Streptomyces sp. NPDC091281 TaxID=3365985 RepID=UPI00382F8320